MFDAILFDLDGTFVDTAPDLANTLNELLQRHGYKSLAFETIRPVCSQGVRGLLKIGFGCNPNDEDFDYLREEFLEIYDDHLLANPQLFPNVANILKDIKKQKISWGIVTNKPEDYTFPLLQHLKLKPSQDCVVCGDTLNTRKPSPKPLLYAAEILQIAPEKCIYVGDDERDVIAAKAAGMKAAVVKYGYHHKDVDPYSWQADYYFDDIIELSQLMSKVLG